MGCPQPLVEVSDVICNIMRDNEVRVSRRRPERALYTEVPSDDVTTGH